MPTRGETGFGYKKMKRNRITVFRSANRFPVYRLQHYSKCNNFQVISDLLNSDNLKVAITQLCHELQV